MGYRFYDSRTGRFISQDPAGDGDNWYAYCGNSPTNGIDPEGLSQIFAPRPTQGISEVGAFQSAAFDSFAQTEGLQQEFWHDTVTSWHLRVDGVPTWVPVADTGWIFDGSIPLYQPSAGFAQSAATPQGAVEIGQMAEDGITVGKPGLNTILHRIGENPESAQQLANAAKQAEAHPDFGVHGVSVLSKAPPKYPNAPSATWDEISKYFNIMKTGKNPFHYTIELPKPVTEEVANLFNRLFGRL